MLLRVGEHILVHMPESDELHVINASHIFAVCCRSQYYIFLKRILVHVA